MGKAPFVAMKTDLPKEVRVEVIADITGFDRDQVLGKLFRLWAWCTDRGLDDAPEDCDGYAVPARVIRQFLGERGVEALLGDDCDELAMAARRPDGLFYLRGTDETVSRLRTLRSTASAGGLAARDRNKRDGAGRFVRNQQSDQLDHRQSAPDEAAEASECNEPTIFPADGPAGHQPATSRQPAASQPDTGSSPAASSEIPQTTDHKDQNSLAARAILPSTSPGTRYDADSPAERDALAKRTYQRVSDARIEIAAELGMPEPLPFPLITPATRPQQFRELLDRVREEGAQAPRVCDWVVESLKAQARDEQSIDWLSLKAFSSGAWQHARDRVPGHSNKTASRRDRAGPRSRDPTTGRVEPNRPEEYPTGDQKL
jgi:hypothetical protein